jgi:hypothetical protein
MALNDYQLDPQYLNYEVDFNTIVFGVHDYKKKVHLLDKLGQNVDVDIFYFRNIEINVQGEISVQVKPFVDFNDYYSRLMSTMSSFAENAKDKSRIWQYEMVTTISKGYDAPCCAAVAKRLGCDTAVTFQAEGKYKDDCGTEIAKALGYKNVKEKDALSCLNREDCVEAFYIAPGKLGSEISFFSFDDECLGRIVFTGDRGDSVWGRNSKNRNDVFSFNDILSHLGCTERRLWLGYISVPMPL